MQCSPSCLLDLSIFLKESFLITSTIKFDKGSSDTDVYLSSSSFSIGTSSSCWNLFTKKNTYIFLTMDYLLFCSFHFSFLVFGHFWRRSYENTKILRNLCLGQDRKKTEKKLSNGTTEIPKTKRRKYGMNKTLDGTCCLLC